MMKNLFFLTLILLFVSCNHNLINKWENYDESEEIKTNATIENKRLLKEFSPFQMTKTN